MTKFFAMAKNSRVSLIFTIWFLICFLYLSPYRYNLFQMILATSYPWQSLSAFFNSIVLVLYVPIIFFIHLAVSTGLPIYLYMLAVSQYETSQKKWTLIASVILIPFVCILSSIIFFYILPFTAKISSGLHYRDVVKSANGPAYTYHKYLFISNFTDTRGNGELDETKLTDRDKMMLHIVSFYLHQDEYSKFMNKAYPLDQAK